MSHTKLNRTQRKELKESSNRFWSILLTIAMLLQSTPVTAYARMEDPEQTTYEEVATTPEETDETVGEEVAPEEGDGDEQEAVDEQEPEEGSGEESSSPVTSPVAEEQSQQQQTAQTPAPEQKSAEKKQADIIVTANNATVAVAGKQISATGSVSVPAGAALTFTVAPANGYTLQPGDVTVVVDGASVAMTAGEKGIYTIGATEVRTGTKISVNATRVPTQTVYEYTDENITVTATLDDATAIPDEAMLRVSGITRDASENRGEYNFGSYMKALNNFADASDENPVYTEDNTLLYDVAFLWTDPATGKTVELQPKQGSVTVKFEFKKGQLSQFLGAEKAEDVEVIHLPLANEVKAETTAKSTNFSADSVIIDKRTGDDRSSEGDNIVAIRTNTFSAFAVSYISDATSQADEDAKASTPKKNTKENKKADDGAAMVVQDESAELTAQADTYNVDVEVIDYNGNAIANPQGIGSLAVTVTNQSRSNQTATKNVALNNGKGSVSITTFGTSTPFVLGDNVKSTISINGTEYKDGDNYNQYIVRVYDDSKNGKGTITLRERIKPEVTIEFRDADGAYILPWFDTSSCTYWVYLAVMENGAEVGHAIKQIPAKEHLEKLTFDGFVDKDGSPVFLNKTSQTVQATVIEYWGDISDAQKGIEAGDGVDFGDGETIQMQNCHVFITAAAPMSSPFATVTFKQFPTLELTSELLDENGNATTQSPEQYYYALYTTTQNGYTFADLVPLRTSATDAGTSIYNSGNAVETEGFIIVPTTVPQFLIYDGTQDVTLQVVGSTDSNLSEANAAAGTNCVQYSSGQITTDGYQVNIERDGDESNVILQKRPDAVGSTIDLTINLYDEDQANIEKADPAINEDLYLLVSIKPKDAAKGDMPSGWQVIPLSSAKSELNSNGTTSYEIPAVYHLCDSNGEAVGDETIEYDPSLHDFTLRLYRKTGGGDISTYNNIRDGKNAVDTINGYDFKGTTKSDDGKSATLELYRSVPKTYTVDIEIDPAGLSLADSDNYYLFVKGEHESQTHYFLEKLNIGSGDTKKEVAIQTINSNGQVVSKWADGNGNIQANTSISGSWNVSVYVVRAENGNINMNQVVSGANCVILDDGQPVKNYLLTTKKLTHEKVSSDKHYNQAHTDYVSEVDLTKIEVEDAITPEDILGNAAEFGITANRLEQDGHSETNFALNSLHYSGNCDIDGSGDNPIPFVISVIDEDSELWLSERMRVPADVFVGVESQDRVKVTSTKDVTVNGSSASELRNRVNALIGAGQAKSQELAGKITISPKSDGNRYTLDTTGFPDGTTIYVNADGIANAISNDGGLFINKLPGQSIVFNISKTDNGNGILTIGQFNVDPHDGNGTVNSTTAALDDDPARNLRVDQVIFEHITFNATNASTVHLNNTAGLFLLPQADLVTQSNGSGWILAKGTVKSDKEWHFYRHTRRYKAKGSFTLRATKKLIDSNGDAVAFENKNFTFKLYQVIDGKLSKDPIETTYADPSTGEVFFSSVRYTQNDVEKNKHAYFTYQVVEVIPNNAVNAQGRTYKSYIDAGETPQGTFSKDGITYSAEPITVEVDAFNNPNSETEGNIEVKIKIQGASDFITPDGEIYDIGYMTNKKSKVTTNLKVQKGADYQWGSADAFTFTLEGVEANDSNGTPLTNVPMPAGSTDNTKQVVVDGPIAQAFGEITYEIPGNYGYKVTETIPADASATVDGTTYTYAQATASGGLSPEKIASVLWRDKDGVCYDATTHYITVAVADGDPMTVKVYDNSVNITTDPTITFYNQREQKGALKLRKRVTVDGKDTTNTYADGTYAFTIEGQDESNRQEKRDVTITVTNGVAVSATINGEAAPLNNLRYLEVPDLYQGNYKITEIDPKNGTYVIGTNPKYVTVVAGKTGDAVPDKATETFVNDFLTGGFKIYKQVRENEELPSAAAKALLAGTYKFNVYTDEACTQPLVAAKGPVSVKVTIDETGAAVTSEEVKGLKPGDYWIEEDPASLGPNVAPIEGKQKVTVEAGKTGSAAVIVTFTNNVTTGGFNVVKRVQSTQVADKTRQFEIVVTLGEYQGEKLTGTYGEVDFVDGVGTFTLSQDQTKQIRNLPLGVTYTIHENVPDGYTVSGAVDKEFTATKSIATRVVTNTRNTTAVQVKKVWDDKDNQDGERPKKLNIALFANKTMVHTVELNEKNNWTSEILRGLPTHDDNGNKIEFKWFELDLTDGYKRTKTETVPLTDGSEVVIGTLYTITNTYSPKETEASVLKEWKDDNDRDRIRPKSVTVTLMKKVDGAASATVVDGYGDVELNEDNGWKVTVDKLPQYEGGKKITYSWTEKAYWDESQQKYVDGLPKGYSLSGTTKGTLTTLTNSYTPEDTKATVKKVWNDDEDRDKLRPAELVVTLMKQVGNGEKTKVQDVTLNAENGWSATIDKLYAKENGVTIKYTWEENNVPAEYTLEGISSVGTVTTITNKHVPVPTWAKVTKVWKDDEDRDVKRPTELIVALLANGKVATKDGKPVYVTLNKDNNWTATVDGLNKLENGQPIDYTWTENEADLAEIGYTLTNVKKDPATNDAQVEGYVTELTNTYEPETTEALVYKLWEDGNDQDGVRPKELVVKLLADGEDSGRSVKLNEGNKWYASITGLTKYKNVEGKPVEIKYTWSEDEAALAELGYKLTSNATIGTVTSLTNTRKPNTVNATVKKVWNDSDDRDKIRPDSLTVVLMADGKAARDSQGKIMTVTLTSKDQWAPKTLKNLPERKDGKVITYSWKESNLPAGYELTNTSVDGEITTLTNSYTPKFTQASVRKVWVDGNDQDGYRPASITVKLMADGEQAKDKDGNEVIATLSAENGWQYNTAPEALYKLKDGKEIKYTWWEDEAELAKLGYKLKSTATVGTLTTITNEHEPEETTAEVVKIWKDGDNQDGKRPTTLNVGLLANGEQAKDKDGKYVYVTLSKDNDWRAKVTGLPKKAKVNGQSIDIVYKWQEQTWAEGADNTGALPVEYKLTSTVIKNSQGNVLNTDNTAGYITELTNSYEPLQTKVQVVKIWDDANDQDRRRPTELTVTLMKTLEGGTTKTKVQDVKLDKSNAWAYEIDKLPVYEAGKKITYSWEEQNVPTDYELVSINTSGFITSITNKHKPIDTKATVVKVWNDADNQDGIRPKELKVALLADGQNFKIDGEWAFVTLNDANNWTATIDKLPKYKDGKEIFYSWEEDKLPEGYKLESIDPANANAAGITTTIKNTHKPETTKAQVYKQWVDSDNQDNVRPKDLTVTLMKTVEGSATTTEVKDVTLNKTNSWTTVVDNLPAYEAGKKITYSWVEKVVPENYELKGYDTTGIVTTITNEHKPFEVWANVHKIWNDDDNRDHKRPTQLKVGLLADGKNFKIGDEWAAVTLNDDNNWTASIEHLPKYKDGKEIVYAWAEEGLPEEYTLTNTRIVDAKGNVVTTGNTADCTTELTNSYKPKETEATVYKVWIDNNNQDALRPSELKVSLQADGEQAKDAEGKAIVATLNDANNWTFTKKNLPAYKNGVKIRYEWVEDEAGLPTGYVLDHENSKTVGTITSLLNVHKPETTTAYVEKVWEDDNNRDGIQPESIYVALLADNMLAYDDSGTPIVRTLPGEDGKWSATVSDLPKKQNGHEIAYTWTEVSVPEGYTMTTKAAEGHVNGTTITNTHEPELTEVTLRKVWVDNGNQDGKRPETLEVKLLANGFDTTKTVTLTNTDNWAPKTIDKLLKYENGKEIKYTWAENEAELKELGYTLSNTYVSGTTTTFTNSRTPDTVAAKVIKKWEDQENKDGVRPVELQVALLADGMLAYDPDGRPIAPTLTADDWSYEVEGLPKYQNGTEIKYKWIEVDVPRPYTLKNSTTETIEGVITTTITNEHEPEPTGATVRKVWADSGNQDGVRPKELEVKLLADGVQAKDRSGNDVIATLSADNNWQFSTADNALDKYANGKLINYKWEEDEDALKQLGYTLSSRGVVGTVTTLTNTRKPDTTWAKVTKVWDDKDNQDGKRPAKLNVGLLANGAQAKDASGKYIFVELNETNKWTAQVNNLPKKANGVEIVYSWEEQTYSSQSTDNTGALPEEYKFAGYQIVDGDGNVVNTNNGAGYTTKITNKYTPETTKIMVYKEWEDANNQDGIRPAELTVQLMKTVDGKKSKVQDLKLTAENSWYDGVENLPVYEAGKKITYSWEEQNVPEGYKLKSIDTETSELVTIITNEHKPEETWAEVKKVWDDADNQDGMRPVMLAVGLLADGAQAKDAVGNYISVILNKDNKWTAKVENLPKFANGKEIDYRWVELQISDTWTEKEIAKAKDYALPLSYELVNTEPGDANAAGIVTTLTNKHKPVLAQAYAYKVWNDADNQDGIRPAQITLQLMKTIDGNKSRAKDADDNDITVTLNEDNSWYGGKLNLPAYENGKKIAYSWEELDVPKGYTLTSVEQTTAELTTITNSHTPEATEATVKKIWQDDNNRDGKRPGELHVALLADGKPVVEYGGTTLEVTLNDNNKWNATVTQVKTGENTYTPLPKYRDNGVEIEYSWEEVDYIDEYTLSGTSKNGTVTTLTNAHKTSVTEAQVTKVFDDNENQDAVRPEYIDVQLMRNVGDKTEPATLDNGDWIFAELSAPNWSAKVTNLPKFENGVEIIYTWEEQPLTAANYSKAVLDRLPAEFDVTKLYTLVDNTTIGTNTTLTNAHEPFKTKVHLEKKWDDADNQDGVRPVTLGATLTKNGENTDLSVILNAANKWSATIVDLDKYENGKLIEYGWAEIDGGAGYELEDTDEVDDFENVKITLTNAHSPEKTKATVRKDWVDFENKTGKRPATLVVELLANGEKTGQTVTLNAANNWTATIEDLDKYDNGNEIVYSWDEGMVPGYMLTNVQPTPNDGEQTMVSDTDITLTNTMFTGDLTVIKTVDSEYESDYMHEFVFKVAIDDDAVKGKHFGDEETGMTFDANGVATFTLSHGQNATATGLPVGLKYTITEENADGFIKTWNGTTGEKAEGSIMEGQGNVVECNNKRETGGFKVFKRVDTNIASEKSEDNTFRFIVQLGKLNGEVVSGKIGGMTFDANGRASFRLWDGQTISATGLPVGVTYQVTEVSPAGYTTKWSAIIGDDSSYQDGTESETYKISSDSEPTIAFINKRQTSQITINKEVVSPIKSDLTRDFNFLIQLVDADGMPIDFDAICDDVEFIGGTANFVVAGGSSKTITGLPVGTNYEVLEVLDPQTEKFNCMVGDEHTTSATGTITAEGEEVTFKNIAQVGDLELSKTVESTGYVDKDKAFNFSIELKLNDAPVTGEFQAEGAVEKVTFDEKGIANVQLKHDESVKVIGLPEGSKYTVKEEATEGYTTESVNETGTIDQYEACEVTFTNKYDAKGQVELYATKTLTGKKLEAGAFEFTIADETPDNVAETVKNDANGFVNFTKIDFKLEDLKDESGAYVKSLDYTYYITEVVPADAKNAAGQTYEAASDKTAVFTKNGVRYQAQQQKVTVTVSDDGQGALEAVVKDANDTAIKADEDGAFMAASFLNSVEVKGQLVLSGKKTISGRSFQSGDKATFKIEASGTNKASAPLPAQTQVSIAPTSGTTQVYAFEPITYTQANIPDGATSATFTYIVSESVQSMQGVSAVDSTKYTVTVKISDNGDGTLKIEPSSNYNALNFTNKYSTTKKTTTSTLSKTGDIFNPALVAGLVVAGLAVLAYGLRRRKEEE